MASVIIIFNYCMVKNIKVKMIILGDTFTGKSSLIESYKYRTFSDICSATIGVDFVKSTIKKNDNNYNLFIWDTSGQEKFNSIIFITFFVTYSKK